MSRSCSERRELPAPAVDRHRGRTHEAALIAVALAVALLALPGLPGAYGPSGGHDRPAARGERQRLHEVKEQRARSEALQRALRGQIRTTAVELAALRERHEELSRALQSQQQQAAAQERRLDYLVPRLLARQAEVRERRARTAQALAELASKSRSVQLDSTTRARMLAISPLMFRQLRGLESDPAMLWRPEPTIQRHARLERSLLELTTAQQRLTTELAQRQRQQHGSLEQLRELDAEVRRLGAEQTRLARRVLLAEAAVAASAEPQAAEPALSDGAGLPGARGAAVARGAFAPQELRLARAESRSLAQAEAGAQVPGGLPGLPIRVVRPAWPAVPDTTRGLAATLHGDGVRFWPDGADDAKGEAAPLPVAFQPDGGGAATLGPRGRLARLPTTGLTARQALEGDDRLGRTFAAAPGQQIAAPVDGEIVFAGRFKSYGLLLIIAHEREYHTLLWGFARLAVGAGVPVRVGEVVGIMGGGGAGPPMLHVERRRHGRPINLAASSSGIRG